MLEYCCVCESVQVRCGSLKSGWVAAVVLLRCYSRYVSWLGTLHPCLV